MTYNIENANRLHQAAEQFLSYKGILIEPNQPRLTPRIDQKLKKLKRVMDSGIAAAHREQGIALGKELVEVYSPLYVLNPNDLMIATGVITAFEHLHPNSNELASASNVHQITQEASRKWGDDPKLPTLLDVHGFLHGLDYIIKNFPAE